MEKYIITTGKTIDLAISAAMAQLNLDRDSISVEVLENAKSGFLGIGASPAKIKVTYEVPDEVKPVHEPTPALSSASRSKPKPKAELPHAELKITTPPPALKPEPKKPAPKPEKQPKPEKRLEPKPEKRPEPKRDKPQEKKPPKPQEKKQLKAAAEPQPAKEYAPAAEGSTEEKIEKFIKGLLEHMGSDAVPHASVTEDGTYHVELVGENLGMLIGRRGDTLDAIQHLTNYCINRDAEERCRVNVDAENYRGKREESLQHLAQKMAAKAVRYRKNFTLEPMNAYERHVIHAALQDTPNVSTYSTGTEPNRRLVVAYTRGKKVEE